MPAMPRRAAVVTALRTPIARFGGALSQVRPDDLAAFIIRQIVDRSGIDPALIDDVYFGAANQAGEDNRNVARMAALIAGLPPTVPGSTVNRLCASGLDAINIAARMIEADHGDVFVAGGVESMTRAPYVLSKPDAAFGRNQELFDTSIGWRFVNPRLAELHHPFAMGETAENVARKHGISRADQDAFALASQQKWAAAHAKGSFKDEIAPFPIPQRKGDPLRFDTDEHPRPDTTIQKLAALRPVFAKDDQGTVTAGNSSGINDGSAALLLVEESRARELGLTPLAFVGPSAAAGVDPAYMGVGPARSPWATRWGAAGPASPPHSSTRWSAPTPPAGSRRSVWAWGRAWRPCSNAAEPRAPRADQAPATTFSNPRRKASTSPSISASPIGVDSADEQVLISMYPSSNM